jgi:hypothetical protein
MVNVIVGIRGALAVLVFNILAAKLVTSECMNYIGSCPEGVFGSVPAPDYACAVAIIANRYVPDGCCVYVDGSRKVGDLSWVADWSTLSLYTDGYAWQHVGAACYGNSWYDGEVISFGQASQSGSASSPNLDSLIQLGSLTASGFGIASGRQLDRGEEHASAGNVGRQSQTCGLCT